MKNPKNNKQSKREKIVILDGSPLNQGDLSWEPFYSLGEVTVYDSTSDMELVERAADAAIILTNKVKITAEHLERLPHLRYIGIMATGYNGMVDVKATKQRNIVVSNVTAYSSASVAQMVFAHILNITNRVAHYASEVASGEWSKKETFCYWNTPLLELYGKRIGIVGLGDTGMATAQIAQAFGMKVYVFSSKAQEMLPVGFSKQTLQDLFANCDIISLHCPLNSGTYQLVNKQILATMPSGAILINTGRGGLVNEHDVAAALHEKQLAGYGTDVLSVEPPNANNPLLNAPNCYITPHIAWATPAARMRLLMQCAQNVKSFLDNTPQNKVN